MSFFQNLFQHKKQNCGLTEKAIRWNKFIYEICSRDFSVLSNIQKAAVLSFWYDAEMNSGGHSGYFECYPDVKPPDLASALDLIGASHFADNYNEAFQNGQSDGYLKIDKIFYDFNPSLTDILMEFIENHKEEIFAIDIKVVGTYAVKNMDNVHLIELEIALPPSEIKMDSFSQENEKLPKSDWQVAYDEHYLDETGTRVIGRMFDNQKLLGTSTRIAFFLHNIDFSKPLLWQEGKVQLAALSPIPDRLASIIVYEPAD